MLTQLQLSIPKSFIQYLDENGFIHGWINTSNKSKHSILEVEESPCDNVFMHLSISHPGLPDHREWTYQNAKDRIASDKDSEVKNSDKLQKLVGDKNNKMLNTLIGSLSCHNSYPIILIESTSYSMKYLGLLYNGEIISISFTNKTAAAKHRYEFYPDPY